MDALKPKERLGLYLEGAEAQGMGQNQGALEGPSPTGPVESARPGGRIYQTNFWAERKGRSKVKNGMKNPRWEEASECAMSADENRGCQETNPSQVHGRSEGNNKKQVTSEAESEEVVEDRYYGESEQESFAGKLLGITLAAVDKEEVDAKGGLQCAAVDSPSSVLCDAIQTGGKSRCLPRNSELITEDLRLEVEGEDDTRAERRTRSGEDGVGNFDGTPVAMVKRRCNQYRVIISGWVGDRVLKGLWAGSWADPSFRLRFWAWFTGRPSALFLPFGPSLTGCP